MAEVREVIDRPRSRSTSPMSSPRSLSSNPPHMSLSNSPARESPLTTSSSSSSLNTQQYVTNATSPVKTGVRVPTRTLAADTLSFQLVGVGVHG